MSYAEAIFLTLEDSNKKFNIGSIYCSPAASRNQANAFFSKVLSITGSTIIASDFKAKNTRWNCKNNCNKI